MNCQDRLPLSVEKAVLGNRISQQISPMPSFAKGKKVIIIDMDIGMGNIHILLGMAPQNSLTDYLLSKVEIDEVINETPGGLSFHFWWFWA